jgi:hypothetical protein
MAKSISPRGTLFQHEAFAFNELAGSIVEQLLGVVDPNGVPRILFLKPSGEFWQSFSLDAGINFWLECDDSAIEEALAEDTSVDLGQRYGLLGSRIGAIRGEPAPRITVEFSVGELVLETTSESVLDAPMRLTFRSLQR